MENRVFRPVRALSRGTHGLTDSRTAQLCMGSVFDTSKDDQKPMAAVKKMEGFGGGRWLGPKRFTHTRSCLGCERSILRASVDVAS